MLYTSLTTVDLHGVCPIVVVPVGSFEQHGPHLPLDTDTRIAVAVAEHTLQNFPSDTFMLAPPLAISASDEHRGFAGTLSIGSEAFAASATALAQSAQWAKGIVFVNGHGGNADAFHNISNTLNAQSIQHSIWSPPFQDGDDAHAGKTETSLLLHICPNVVRTQKLVAGNTSDVKSLFPIMRDKGIIGVSANGVLGDATLASATLGSEIFSRYCESLFLHLSSLVTKWSSR